MVRSSHRKCEICGKQEARKDRTQGSQFYSKFPIEENRCREWVRAVGNEDLLYLPVEKLHQLRYVCGDHFEKKHWNRKGSRLKRHAVPNQKLTAPPLTDEQLAEFQIHMKNGKRFEATTIKLLSEKRPAKKLKRASSSSVQKKNLNYFSAEDHNYSFQITSDNKPTQSTEINIEIEGFEDDDSTDQPFVECIEIGPGDHLSNKCSSEVVTESMEVGSWHEIPLKEEILELGDTIISNVEENSDMQISNEEMKLETDIKIEYGLDIDEEVARKFEHTATNGLTESVRIDVLNNHLVPINCKHIDAPQLNPDVKAAFTEQLAKRDKTIEDKQKQMAAGISLLGKIISDQLNVKVRDNVHIKNLMELGDILCDIQHTDSKARCDLALYALKRNMQQEELNTFMKPTS